PGQRIDLGGSVSVRDLEIEIRGVRTAPGADPGAGPVGLAEVGLGSLQVEEVVELPTALVDAVGPALDGNPLTVLLTRLRSDPAEPVRGDEEVSLRRRFELPDERSFSIGGSARLSAHAGGPTIDALIGADGPAVRASSELPGSLLSRASAALDGNAETAWQPAFRDLDGAWLEVSLDRPTSLDHLDLALVADGRHSVPTELRVEVDGVAQVASVPEVAPGERPGTVRRVTVPLAAVTGQRVKVTVTASRAEQTIDYYSRQPISLPFGIAELDVPGARLPVHGQRFDTGCRDDLLTVDGRPVSIRVTGSMSDAIDRRALNVSACGSLVLGAGAHELDAADGAATGVDIDRFVLGSPGRSPDGPSPKSPGSVEVTSRGATRLEATVDAGEDAWLVLGQSHNDGWRARVDGEDLGPPTLVDGGFNGWRIPGASGAREVTVEWRPQRTVDRAILVTASAVVLALVLAFADRRRRTPWQRAGDQPVAVGWAEPPVQWQPAAMAAVVVSMALVGLVVAGPVVALAAAAATLVLLRRPLGGLAVAAAILGLWLLAAGWIVVRQIIDPRRPDFEWIDDLGWPHGLALAAVVLLLTVAVTDVLRSRATPRPADLGRAASAHASLTGLARRSGPARALRRLQSALPARDDRDGPSLAESRPAHRFATASAIGGLAALMLFVGLLTLGRFDLTAWQRVGDFYDAQADAWLDGRWDLPPDTLGIERFEARGRAYMYQGPWPAVLRLPFAAVADSLDGRLTQLSMTLGLGVAIVAAARLHWRIRRLLRGNAPVTRSEAVAVGLGTFAVAGGSALLYVASRAWVYHEALIWGVAWTIVAFDAIVACVVEPTRRRTAWAALAMTLALSSRSSVALGPVVAMAILTAGNLLARWHRRHRPDPSATTGRVDSLVRRLRWLGTAPRGQDSLLPVLAPALATLVPLATYATVNWIKFRTLFSIPFTAQGFTIVDPARQEMLAANNGTLFGLQFAPTTFLQYTRPDALSFTRRFPFVDFPAVASPIGDVRFDLIDRSTSIPVAMTALLALSLVTLVAVGRRPPTMPGHGIAALRVPLLGAIVGALTILPFGYIANRYLADAVPALTIGAAAGLQLLLARVGELPRQRWIRPVLVALGVLVVAGTWINLSLALVYQRIYSPNVKDDVIAGFLDTSYDVGQSLGLDPRVPISTGEELPATAPRGSLFAIGDCDALYISDGMDVNAVKVSPWNAVERTEAGGRYLRLVTFPERPAGRREPIMSIATPSGNGVLFAEWRGGAGIAFAYEGPGVRQESPTRYVPAGRTWTMDLVVDPQVQVIQIWLDDKLMLETYYRAVGGRPVIGRDVTGRDDIADTFGGTMDPLPERAGLCKKLLAEADDR
ncbi:MAG: discoidin domain-containing protein, partial [Acidimicrobiales bacterium]